jgi:intron-binding protein aquarius
MSIIMMVNEKFRENVKAWGNTNFDILFCEHFILECFRTSPTHFASFFQRVLNLSSETELSNAEKNYYTIFLINCFQSLEETMIQKECLK